MNTTKKISTRLTRLKTYFITLIITTAIYLLINSIVMWTTLERTTLMMVGLMTWGILIASIVMLILGIIEAVGIHKEKPEYRFNTQYIIMSVILGVIGVYVLLIFAIALGGSRNITQTTNNNVSFKVVALLFNVSILGLLITFYALSLNKSLKLLNSTSNIDGFINNETPKDEEVNDDTKQDEETK